MVPLRRELLRRLLVFRLLLLEELCQVREGPHRLVTGEHIFADRLDRLGFGGPLNRAPLELSGRRTPGHFGRRRTGRWHCSPRTRRSRTWPTRSSLSAIGTLIRPFATCAAGSSLSRSARLPLRRSLPHRPPLNSRTALGGTRWTVTARGSLSPILSASLTLGRPATPLKLLGPGRNRGQLDPASRGVNLLDPGGQDIAHGELLMQVADKAA